MKKNLKKIEPFTPLDILFRQELSNGTRRAPSKDLKNISFTFFVPFVLKMVVIKPNA